MYSPGEIPSKLAQRLLQKQTETPPAWETQADLAKKLGTTQATVSRLLKGRIKKVSETITNALAAFLKIEPDLVVAELKEIRKDADPFELDNLNIRDCLFLMADNSPYQIYIKDAQRRFIWANPKMLEACQCANLAELKGLQDEDIFDDPHKTDAKWDDDKVLSGASIIDKVEFETWKSHWKLGNSSDLATLEADKKPKKRQKLRLVVTTKKPFYQNGHVIGIVGFTQPYEISLPNFLKEPGNPLNFGEFRAGIYYKNFVTGHFWGDQAYIENFPSDKLEDRWKQVCPIDTLRVAKFLDHLKKLPEANTNGSPATLDFRAIIDKKMRWIRTTGIALGDRKNRTIICGHQFIDDERAIESLGTQSLLSLTKKAFVFIEDEQERYCFMNKPFLDQLGALSPLDILGKRFDDLGIRKCSVVKPSNDINTKENPHPNLDYEALETRNRAKLLLVTLRIPINSDHFSIWSCDKTEDSSKSNRQSHHTLGIAWDISKDKNLELSQTAWARLLSSSVDSVYIKDATNGEYISVNEAFSTRVGMSIDEIVGKTAKEVFHREPELAKIIETEDRSLVESNIGVTHAFRKRPNPKGGFWYESSSKIAVCDSSGKVEYILGISRNVSDQMNRVLDEEKKSR